MTEANTEALSQWEIFKRTSLTDRDLSSVSQAGLVNNLNDGMAWGLFPLLYAATGLSLADIGWLAAIYPAVWSLGQLFTGTLSDRIGRKWLIASGMWVQAAGITVTAVSTVFAGFATGAVLLGVGTAMVYPTLLAAIGDVAHPAWRAGSVGVYRLWRDLGYAVGALLAGVVADILGVQASIGSIAALTLLSGSRCRPADARNEAIEIGIRHARLIAERRHRLAVASPYPSYQCRLRVHSGRHP